MLTSASSSDADALRAVLELHRRGKSMHITPQVIIGFRNVATRPKAADGAGHLVADAEAHIGAFEAMSSLLSEAPGIYPSWKSLDSVMGIIGKQEHDARLVAICHVHQVSHILTFHFSHFARMSAFGPGLMAVDPANV